MYTKTSLKEQAKIINKHFGITIDIKHPPELQNEAEHLFVIPSWSKIASTYGEAVQKVFDAIKSTRPFYNLREGKLGPEYLRERPHKGIIPEIVSAQFGEKHTGESVDTVRKNKPTHEILFGAYEVAIMLLTHPDRITSYESLYIDCAGDECSPGADGGFSYAPCFGWFDGLLEFGFVWSGDAHGSFGALSGFVSQPLETRPLESFDASLDRAIEIVRAAGIRMYKEI